MKYDVLLTNIGSDELSVSFAVMNTIQQLAPIPFQDVTAVKRWFAHLPMLLRRGITREDAQALQQRYAELGATIAITPTRLLFPTNTPDISDWQNEWFSEHLIAMHEQNLGDWAQHAQVTEAYRFSYLPSFGMDMTIRLWSHAGRLHASARRSIGRIGPLPGPPREESIWIPTQDDWTQLRAKLDEHAFWESDSWDTVPEGYIVLEEDHWVLEGWRDGAHHVLCDKTPSEGALHTLGLWLIELLPDMSGKPQIE